MATLPSAFCAVLAERRRLEDLAFRLLGSAGRAEQAVRATYARWYTMPAGDQDRVDGPATWLVSTLVRICVDWRER